MEPEELTHTSADGETYVARKSDYFGKPIVELSVLDSDGGPEPLVEVAFFADEIDAVAELLKRAAK